MRKLVGSNFARIRREKGLTQERVAELSGFSQQYLSGLERGLRNPSVVTLYELARALGVGHLELLTEGQREAAGAVDRSAGLGRGNPPPKRPGPRA